MSEIHPFVQAVLAILATLTTIYGGFWGARKVRGEAKALKEPPPTPYELIVARVTTLEISDREKAAELSEKGRQIEGLERADRAKSSQLGDLESAVNELQQRESRLMGWIARLHAGIMDGSIPPLPSIPPWLDAGLAEMLASHDTKKKDD